MVARNLQLANRELVPKRFARAASISSYCFKPEPRFDCLEHGYEATENPRWLFYGSMETRLLVLALLTVAIRLWGNASVVLLTGIDPRPVAVKKRLLHWGLSLVAAAFAMTLAPLVANL